MIRPAASKIRQQEGSESPPSFVCAMRARSEWRFEEIDSAKRLYAFRHACGKSGQRVALRRARLREVNARLSRRPLVRTDAADMLKRRLKQAGLPAHYSPHSFRATGITNFLENDGTLEAAQRIAGHADSRTTKLYDRRGQKVLLEDMERIRY